MTHSRPSWRRPPGSWPRRCPAAQRSRSSSTRRRPGPSPLYCYRPLTGRFIAQRIGMLSRLPSYPSAAQGLTALPDLPALPRSAAAGASRPAIRARSPTARCRPSSAPSGPTPPTSSSSAERFRRGLRRARGDRVRRLRAVGRDHRRSKGLVIESDEVPLGDGLSLVRATTLADAPAGLSDDPHATVAVLALETSAGDGRALENAGRRLRRLQTRAAPVGRRRARARPDGLGAHRRQRVDGGPARHGPAPPGRRLPAGRPRRRTRCARSAGSSRAARRARASWPGRCGASSSAASAAAPSRRSPTG